MDYDVDPDEQVSTAVVRAASAVAGRAPASLRPLAEILDTNALDALFAPREDGTARPGGRLSFVYGGCRVTVQNGEYLSVVPLGPLLEAERSPPDDGSRQ